MKNTPSYAEIVRRSALPEILFADDVALALRIDEDQADRNIRRGDYGPISMVARRPTVSRESFLATFTVAGEESEPLLIDRRRAARILSISPRKLWEITNRGDIPHIRVGRAVRYCPPDLRAWIERKKGVRR